jgi:hypothetical protein
MENRTKNFDELYEQIKTIPVEEGGVDYKAAFDALSGAYGELNELAANAGSDKIGKMADKIKKMMLTLSKEAKK